MRTESFKIEILIVNKIYFKFSVVKKDLRPFINDIPDGNLDEGKL